RAAEEAARAGRSATAIAARLSASDLAEDRHDPLQVIFREVRPRRQAKPLLEEPLRHHPADVLTPAENRLEVHRLPDRPGLDVLPLQRDPARPAVRAASFRVDRQRRASPRLTTPRRAGLELLP